MDWTFLAVLILCKVQANIGDPCTSFSRLPDLPRRQVSNALEYGETPLCDLSLEEKWYKADRSDMPTKAPPSWSCGTDNPIWLADPIPPADGAEHQLKACIRTLFCDCFRSINIKVKNCGNYNVYYLKSTRACHRAYCFNTKKDKDAPDVTVSNVIAEYSSLGWKKSGRILQTYLTYKCTFQGYKDRKYCYRVDWYIDGASVFENQTVGTEFAEINDTQFVDTRVYKMNTFLQCYVAIKFCDNEEVGKYTVSNSFFIGIKITTPEIKIKENGKGTIKFKSTVPFACTGVIGFLTRNCKTYVQMVNPPRSECGEKITGSGRCAIAIDGYGNSTLQSYYEKGKWKRVYTMKVLHQSAISLLKDNRFHIRLEIAGGSGESKLWDTPVVLPDIFVSVYEERNSDIWESRLCSIISDTVTIKQFDRRKFDLRAKGVYTMYRNRDAKQEVQIQTDLCFGNNFCTCGVAARAGQDVFVLDHCIRPKLENFISRRDEALNVLKLTEKSFKVIFPSGATVEVDISSISGYIKVYVYPFENDFKKTEGLCGNLDGLSNHFDLQLKNNQSYDTRSPPNAFTNSWRPTSMDNLFSYESIVYDSLASLRLSQMMLCICELNSKSSERGRTMGIPSKITCRYEKYATCGIRQRWMPSISICAKTTTKTSVVSTSTASTTKTLTTVASTSNKSKPIPPTIITSTLSSSTTNEITKVASTSPTSRAATPSTFALTLNTSKVAPHSKLVDKFTKEISTLISSSVTVTSTTSSSEKLFSTTCKIHNNTVQPLENASLAKTCACVIPPAIIVILLIMVVVLCLLVTAVVILVNKRRNKTEVSSKSRENADTYIETVHNQLYGEITEVESQEIKDFEMSQYVSIADVQISGPSTEMSVSEQENQNIQDKTVLNNGFASSTLDN